MDNFSEKNYNNTPERNWGDYMPPGSSSYFEEKRELLQEDNGRNDAENDVTSPSHISSLNQNSSTKNVPNPSASLPLMDVFAPPVRKKHTGIKVAAAAVAFVLLCVLGGSLYVLISAGFFDANGAVDNGSEFVLPEIDMDDEKETEETDLPIYVKPDGVVVELEVVEAGEGSETLSNADIYDKCIGSTVGIYAESGLYASAGTGIIMTDDGYIITNNHIIEGTDYLEITLGNGEVYEGELVGRDPTYDIAVLKIDAHDLQVAEFGNSDALRPGDSVVAIGNPAVYEELTGSITAGIVSANNRRLVVDGTMMTLIQTDTPLNNGNSGGPLINAYGQVVGINVMKYVKTDGTSSYEGLGFAIPMSFAKPIIDELIENGEIVGRPSMGIMAIDVAADEEENTPAGVYVSEITEGSKAENSEIKAGDIIVAVEGKEITTRDELVMERDKLRAGDVMKLTVYRDGEYIDIELELTDEGSLN